MTNKEIVAAFFAKGYNEHDYPGVFPLLHERYYDHSPASARNPSDAVNILKIVQSIFPDMTVTILELIEENNLVAGRFKFKATHSSDYMGVKATGKPIEWEALEIFRIADGVIAESWGYWPDSEILSKLTMLAEQ